MHIHIKPYESICENKLVSKEGNLTVLVVEHDAAGVCIFSQVMFSSEGGSHTDSNTFHAVFAVCCCAGAFLTSCPGAGQRQRLLSECTQLKETSSQPSASSLLLLYTVYLFIYSETSTINTRLGFSKKISSVQHSSGVHRQKVLRILPYGSCLVPLESFLECSVSWNQVFLFY